MRGLRALAGIGLALLAPSAGAALDDRFLERVDAYRADGHVQIVIRLTGSFRYVDHSLSKSGDLLQVQLAPGDGAEAAATGTNLLRPPPSVEVPLQSVSASVSGATPTVVLTFLAATPVERVEIDPGEPSLVVTIPSFGFEPLPQRPAARRASPAIKSPQAPLPAPAATAARGTFVLVLGSDAAPADAELIAALEPQERLYHVLTHPDGVARQHLQLGFFDSDAAARARLARLPARHAGAWVAEITRLERERAAAGTTPVDLATLTVRPDRDATLPPVSVERLGELADEARRAATDADYARAHLLYARIAEYPVAPYRQDAIEALGVVREKSGQAAQAKAAYEDYLRRYPDGAGAERVRQRLQALIDAAAPPRLVARERISPEREPMAAFDLFGNFDQSFRQDRFSASELPVRTTRSLLNNTLDLNGRRRGRASDLRLRVSASYDEDFLDADGSEARTSAAYAEFNTRDQAHTARLGRQTRSSGGILGRFDGLYYGYRPLDWLRLNLAAGAPVAVTSEGLDSHRRFLGASTDLGPYWNAWNFTLYGAQQQVDGLTDRRAVGGELRYFADGRTLSGLLDYDLYFGEPNIAYLIASSGLGDATLSLIADRRKAPLLATSNALMGQTAQTIEDLGATYSEAELRELARDRTPTSTTLTANLSHPVLAQWRLSGDLTRTELTATPASGGVAAIPASGPDWYYGLQLVGTGLIRPGDVSTFGLRRIDATTYSAVSGLVDLRFAPIFDLRPSLRLRADRRQPDVGEPMWLYGSSLRLFYTPRPHLTFELEAASDFTSQQLQATTDHTRSEYYYLGYRYEF